MQINRKKTSTDKAKNNNVDPIIFDTFLQKHQLQQKNVNVGKTKGRPYKQPVKLIIIGEQDNIFSFYEHD
jgi:hypothetical protein